MSKLRIYLRGISNRAIGYGRDNVAAARLITRDMPDMGPALAEVMVEAYRRNPALMDSPVSPGEKIWNQDLSKLPRRRLHKAKRSYNIVYVGVLPGEMPVFDYASGIDEATRALLKDPSMAPPEPTIGQILAETACSLEAHPPKLKPREFDWARFVAWVKSRQSILPRSDADLQRFITELIHEETVVDATRDPWDQLDIDWAKYHPAARRLLDEPYFWSSTDEFAPHGNDAGSDVLASFERWRQRNKPKVYSRTLLEGFLKRWGLGSDPNNLDDHDQKELIDVVIGFAFAHIKLTGGCPD